MPIYGTSPEYYGEIISTRNYQDRLDTLANVRAAGIRVCCGGIVGMGESPGDRAGLLVQLANLPEHPGSVPVNSLVRVAGTPMQDADPISPAELARRADPTDGARCRVRSLCPADRKSAPSAYPRA